MFFSSVIFMAHFKWFPNPGNGKAFIIIAQAMHPMKMLKKILRFWLWDVKCFREILLSHGGVKSSLFCYFSVIGTVTHTKQDCCMDENSEEEWRQNEKYSKHYRDNRFSSRHIALGYTPEDVTLRRQQWHKMSLERIFFLL